MSYDFNFQSYHSTQAVLIACAREWLTADGLNDADEVRRSFATSGNEALADEMIDDWNLDAPREDVMRKVYCTEDESTLLAEWDADHSDVMAAFRTLREEYAALEDQWAEQGGGDEVEPDEAFEVRDGVHVAKVELTVEEGFVLGMRRAVELCVTRHRLVLSYRREDGRAGSLAWEPNEPEAQALAYRQALTHPRDEALDLAWQAKRRDEAEAVTN